MEFHPQSNVPEPLKLKDDNVNPTVGMDIYVREGQLTTLACTQQDAERDTHFWQKMSAGSCRPHIVTCL